MLSPKILESAKAKQWSRGLGFTVNLKDALEELEKQMIREGLRRTGWNKITPCQRAWDFKSWPYYERLISTILKKEE